MTGAVVACFTAATTADEVEQRQRPQEKGKLFSC